MSNKRHISTLTPEEGAGLWNEIMPSSKPFQGTAYHFKKSEKAPERVVFMYGLSRLGIHLDGSKIWADSDMSPLTLDMEKASEYLAGIGISFEI